MAYNCPKPKKESTGDSSNRYVSAKMISSDGSPPSPEILDDPLRYLLSDE